MISQLGTFITVVGTQYPADKNKQSTAISRTQESPFSSGDASVNISPEARAKLAALNGQNADQPLMMSALTANQDINNLTIGPDVPLENLANFNWATGAGATYVGNGKAVTAQNYQQVMQQSSVVYATRMGIVSRDEGSGKTPQQTLADVINYMSGQSSDYLGAIDWQGRNLTE